MPFFRSSTEVAGTDNHTIKGDSNSDQMTMNQTSETSTAHADVTNHFEDVERYNGDVAEGEAGQQWTHVDRHSNSRHSQKRRMLKSMGNSTGAVDNINTLRPRSYRSNTSRDNPGSVGSHTLPRARTVNHFQGSQQPNNGIPDDVISSTSQLNLTSGPNQSVEPRLIQSDHVSPTSPTSTSVSSSELHNGFENGSGTGCENGSGKDNYVPADCHPHGRPMRPRGGLRSYCDTDDFSPRGYYSYRPHHPINHVCNNPTSGQAPNIRPHGRFARSPSNASVEEQWRRPANGPGWRRPHHTMSFPSRGHGSYYSHRFNTPNTFNHYQARPRFRMTRPPSPPKGTPPESFKSYNRPTFESPITCATTSVTTCDIASVDAQTIVERPEVDRQTTSWAAAVAAPPPQNEEPAVANENIADSSLIAFMQSQWKHFSHHSERLSLSTNTRAFIPT